MKRIFLLFIPVIIVVCRTNAQDQFDYYNKNASIADTFFIKGQYQAAANQYNTVFALNHNQGKIGHRYKLACCYALLNKNDSAFQQLFHITEKGGFSGIEKLKGEAVFQSLHSEIDRWDKLINLVMENKRAKGMKSK